jgi:hypothetical protein
LATQQKSADIYTIKLNKGKIMKEQFNWKEFYKECNNFCQSEEFLCVYEQNKEWEEKHNLKNNLVNE